MRRICAASSQSRTSCNAKKERLYRWVQPLLFCIY